MPSNEDIKKVYRDSEKNLRLRDKVALWGDNENSYTSQMVRTIKYFAELK